MRILLFVLLTWAVCRCADAANDKIRAHQPKLSQLDNGVIRIAVDLNLGGAIVDLGPSGKDVNLVNSHDWGRQIQMSYYSGPNPYAVPGKEPHLAWKQLGWNPIQSGDVGGHSSKVLESTNDGKTLYVKCVPMQWPLVDVPGECTFESWITLDGPTAKIRGRLNNARSDKTQYRGRHQECPAVYTNGPWWKLMTYTGDKPFSGGALEQIPAKMPWTRFRTSERWAALVDDNDWGLGIWQPATTHFLGGFAGKPGKGGPKDGPTGYIAPIRSEILDHNIVHDYSYVLILGSLKDIRDYVYKNAPKPAPPSYVFEKDRQGFIYHNATDAGWPIKGQVRLTLSDKNAELSGPADFFQAADARSVLIEAAIGEGIEKVSLSWKVHGQQNGGSAALAARADGVMRSYTLDLPPDKWAGAITDVSLRISGRAGATIDLKRLSFSK